MPPEKPLGLQPMRSVTSDSARAHILEIRDRVREWRGYAIDPSSDYEAHLNAQYELARVQEDCLHLTSKEYTIDGVSGFSCGACGLREGAQRGQWDRRQTSRRDILVGRLRKAWWAFMEHCQSFSTQRRTFRICHYYDYSTTPLAYVRGRGDPSSIAAYLQFRAEVEINEEAIISNEGMAHLLVTLYGYSVAVATKNCGAVDLYEARDYRCGRNWHNRVAKLLYWRPGIPSMLLDAIEPPS